MKLNFIWLKKTSLSPLTSFISPQYHLYNYSFNEISQYKLSPNLICLEISKTHYTITGINVIGMILQGSNASCHWLLWFCIVFFAVGTPKLRLILLISFMEPQNTACYKHWELMILQIIILECALPCVVIMVPESWFLYYFLGQHKT